MSLASVPKINPRKTPKEAFNANIPFFPANNSPMRAPKNGMIKIPMGGKIKNPAISPNTLPQTPHFPAPNFLAPHTGSI